MLINYLTDPRKNRNSGARKITPNLSKIQTVESRDIRTKEYLGKSYIVYGTTVENVNGELLRYETVWKVID